MLIIVVGVDIGIAQAIAVSNKKKFMEEKLESLPDFSPTQKIMGNNGDTGLAVDEERKKVVLIDRASETNSRVGFRLNRLRRPETRLCQPEMRCADVSLNTS